MSDSNGQSPHTSGLSPLGNLSSMSVNGNGLPIAIDAMEGDHGIEVQVEGAILANKEFGAKSILVGPEDDLKASLEKFGASDLPITIQNATEVITMDESPAKAVRRKPDSSLCVAYQLCEDGKASAVLSSGNSGAMMAAGRMICGLLPGIERPAIATLIPVEGGGHPNVIIDSGANVDCHAQNLVQFAVMGSIYFNSLFGGENPRVSLLSNGTERSKGTDVIRAASVLLEQLDSVNYLGYIEGRDVTLDKTDVIVCDGFVGNVLLKSAEGCVRLIYHQILHEAKKGLVARFGLLLSRRVFRQLFSEKFDYRAKGGAPLLGLKKLAVVLHGSSDSKAVKNAVRLAAVFSENKMTEKISTALTRLDENVMMGMDGEILGDVFAKGRDAEFKKSKKAEDATEEEGERS